MDGPIDGSDYQFLFVSFACCALCIIFLISRLERNDPVCLRRGAEEVKQTQVLSKENPFNVKLKNFDTKKSIEDSITFEVSVKFESSLHIYWNVKTSALDEFVNASSSCTNRNETQSRKDVINHLNSNSRHNEELEQPDFGVKQYKVNVPTNQRTEKDQCSFALLVVTGMTNQFPNQDGNDIVSRILVIEYHPSKDSSLGHWVLSYDCIGSQNGKLYKLKEVFSCGVPEIGEQSEPYECQPGPSNENDDTSAQFCLVCHTARVTRVLLPCRHACVCGACFKRLKTCPLCRYDIESYFLCVDELALPATQEEIALETSNELSQMSPMQLASAIWNAS